MVQGGVVVFGGRQPACILRLALRHFSSPPFYLFSNASTISAGHQLLADLINRIRVARTKFELINRLKPFQLGLIFRS